MTSASTFSEQEPIPDHEAEPGTPAAAWTSDVGVEALPERKAPVLAEECILHGKAPSAGEVTVIVSQLALKQVAMHSRSNLDCEVGGVLLGHAYRANGRVYLDVRAAIPAVTADHGPIHFTFTADAWAQLHKDRTQRYPELDIVGWFHTHPDLGVFYSSDDVVVHSAAFTLPWHVGMVVDPLRGETSFFGWKQGSLVAYPGFYEHTDLQPESLLEWRMVPTAVWDHPYEPSEVPRYGSSRVYLPATGTPALPPLKMYIGYGLAALGLLLSIIILLAWVLPLTREVDRLQDMVIVLADSALADSNAALCPDPRLRILSPLDTQFIPAGSSVEVMGTAMIPDVSRYQIDVRPGGGNVRWTPVDSFRGSTRLGELTTLNTESWPPGTYEVRLQAVDNNNIRLPGSPNCAISLDLGS